VLYSSVASLVGPPTCVRAPDTCLYIPRLTEEYRDICSTVNREIYWFFYITPVLAASPDGEPPKQGTYRQQNNNNSSSRHINHNDNPYSLHTTIHCTLSFYDTNTSHSTTQSRCHVIVGATAFIGSSHVQNCNGEVASGRRRRMLEDING
jgi:hypothetical protein